MSRDNLDSLKHYQVYISSSAEKDLADIGRYIFYELSAPVAAFSMIEAAQKAIEGLSEMPHRYALVLDERLAAMGYRKIIVKNYIVFFSVDEKEKAVNVERILFGRRDWQNLL